jgi:sigma-B regulation protein RsbU (phosphoserine phosphatase)
LEQAKSKIETYSNALDAEMAKGKKIQREFLPRTTPYFPGWEIAFYFHPAKQVSGDFYDAFALPGERLGLVIADVCDKGIGSALYMALFRSLIRVFSGQINLRGLSVPGSEIDTEELTTIDLNQSLHAVTLTNDYIAQEHGHEGMFATLFFGVLDPASGQMAYINGGHEPLFIVNASGVKASLRAAGPVIGMMSGAKYKIQLTQLEPGDILIGYTDGVTEALSPENKLFTKERFLATLEKSPSSASALIEQIKTDLHKHVNDAPQFDDITMLAVHREV